MWKKGWREAILTQINQPWDIIIIGGGITGAGILREATHAGLRVLLLEANDFSYGTSSRSSKLVHGGFRYLRNRQFSVTRESVREREWMLREAESLVTPLCFLMPNYESYHTPNWQFELGVFLYDIFAPKWNHRTLSPRQFLQRNPHMNSEHLIKGFEYYDAQMDDSRLVLRILLEAVAKGGAALNYARVEGLLRTKEGQVCGVRLQDRSKKDGKTYEIQAGVVINATGPWGDEIRSQIDAAERLRKLRGSHLIFPCERLPLSQAVTLFHPRDRRAMFAFPWEGVAMIGTTDLDHLSRIDDPRASEEEIDYMLEAAHATFPNLGLTHTDILSTISGLRPIIRSGAADPSKESRAHVVWDEDGLLTITGGKITTFRIMTNHVLQVASSRLPGNPVFPTHKRTFDILPDLQNSNLNPSTLAYLAGRYGAATPELLQMAQPGELENIDTLPNIWAELRWTARSEGILHLEDLLLRRVRIGLQLPDGAAGYLPRIRAIVQAETDWDDSRWDQEVKDYLNTWQNSYSPAPRSN